MIVKFHNRGTGGGKGPVQYLLGRENDRDQAELLRGDPDQIVALIDSSRYAKKYTSVVLSFAEPDLPAQSKQQIMDSFERALFPGLDPGQYGALWVQHQDKGRLELNLVVPNVELTSGKRLQPYYDRADRPRVNAWKNLVNAHYGLHDPDDPINAQTLTLPSDLPKASQEAAEAVTGGMLALVSQGLVKSREGVVRALEQGGFEIARETKTSISIKNPEGGRNIRLKGALYAQDFNASTDLRAELEAASERYAQSRERRVQEAKSTYQRGIEIKRADQQRRYPRPEPAIEGPRSERVALDGPQHRPGVGRELRGSVVHARPSAPEFGGYRSAGAPSQGPQAARRKRKSELVRQEAVRSDRRKGPEVPRGLPDSDGGPLDDRVRENALGVIERVIERARAAAHRAAEAARELANRIARPSGAVEACRGLERASGALEQAIDQTIKLEKQRALDKGRGWSPSR